MTFTILPANAFADRRDAAEVAFGYAQTISAGGITVAREYALAHCQALTPTWNDMTEAQRKAQVDWMASSALGCARNIVRDGRAHYVKEIDGAPYQIVCTLIADATAGPVGYQLWDKAVLH